MGVDAIRLKREYTRFLKGQSNLLMANTQGLYTVGFPDEIFPSFWLGSCVTVIFDFRGTKAIENICCLYSPNAYG